MLKKLDAYDEACIAAGNATAHGGNAKYDAKLYNDGRKNYNVYTTIYGLHPAIVSTCKSTNLYIRSWVKLIFISARRNDHSGA
jgi:hypothetical protein